MHAAIMWYRTLRRTHCDAFSLRLSEREGTLYHACKMLDNQLRKAKGRTPSRSAQAVKKDGAAGVRPPV